MVIIGGTVSLTYNLLHVLVIVASVRLAVVLDCGYGVVTLVVADKADV